MLSQVIIGVDPGLTVCGVGRLKPAVSSASALGGLGSGIG